ncbi:MAG: nitroreductase family protein [Tannerellaceae bacterium]|jgi:nitroreductase|nr:nitroreductase family protein [Tannerellaceae bacterium]
MKSFSELIKARRSTRRFTEELLTPEAVELILKAGLMSPSSKRSTPWQFIVVEDKEILLKLSEAKPQGAAFLRNCPLAIVVAADVSQSEAWVEDAAIASILMQLQAEDLGLGSCWCQIRGRQTADGADSARYVCDVLHIPYPVEVLSIIAVGYKAKENTPFDASLLRWEAVHIGKYDSEGSLSACHGFKK